MNGRIRRAAEVSDCIFGNIDTAKAHLGPFMVNGWCVIADRQDVRANLGAAKAAIERAIAALDGFTDWPTDSDYDRRR